MRYKVGKKEETHTKMLSAAGETFRQYGFSGIGVDGLTKAAGVTSGAFYKHFSSKNDAFSEVLALGLDEVIEAITEFKTKYGRVWWKEFAVFYVGERRLCDLGQSCSLQSLSGEVMRSETPTKQVFERKLEKIIEATGDDFDIALNNLATLIGGVTLARSVDNPELANKIANAISKKFL